MKHLCRNSLLAVVAAALANAACGDTAKTTGPLETTGGNAQGGGDNSGGKASGGSSMSTGGTGSSAGGSSENTGGSNPTSGGSSSTSGGTGTTSGGTTATGGKATTATGGKATTGGAGSSGAASGGRASTGGRSGTGGSTTGGSSTGGSTTGGSSTGGTAGMGAMQPSPGCSTTTKPKEGEYTIAVGASQRGYHLVPSTTTTPVPLVLSFHGAGGTGLNDVGTFNIVTLSQGKVVMMLPNGVAQSWAGGGVGWDTRNNTNEDMQLVRALIDKASTEHCIDLSRIYAVGFSWGGWMSNQVGCALAPQVRAIVSVEGGGPGGTCAGAASAMIVHGTADTAEPLSSGQKSRDTWTKLDACMTTTMDAGLPPCVAYAGCSKRVWWCQHDAGHEVSAFVKQGVWDFLMNSP